MFSPETKAQDDMWSWARPKKKYVYSFNEGSLEDKNILGNKGANLCEMVRLGVPVPPGFILTTECCLDFLSTNPVAAVAKPSRQFEQMKSDYKAAVASLETQTGRRFGGEFPVKTGTPLPLLLAVRSGAPVSMPGMLDTVLNLGLNDQIAEGLAHISQNPRWAYDTYRRFLQMFGTVVLGLDERPFQEALGWVRQKRGVQSDGELLDDDLREVVRRFKLIVSVPDDPWEQLDLAIQAVFRSWNTPRAVKYRDINDIRPDLGTAVTVQSMVYGNLNAQSGSGVAFTRNPTTGEKGLCGQYLAEAEGEEVMIGLRTPITLEDLRREAPQVFDRLSNIAIALERHFRDMQNIEFTVENKSLYILQTSTAKRTARAGVSVAVCMVKERLISEREALLRIDATQMDFFLHAMVDKEFANPDDPKVKERVLGQGLGVSAGAAVGRAVFSVEDAVEYARRGLKCILVLPQTSAADMDGLKAAEGVLTLQGGPSSHTASVMRVMGKSAVVGANKDIAVDEHGASMSSLRHPDGRSVQAGDTITIDGSTGLVYLGELPTVRVGQDDNFRTVMQWADKYRQLRVLADAESVEQVEQARRMGAEGIGQCRTEGMFLHPDRVTLFRQVILAQDAHERSSWLHQLLPLQTGDFLQMFRLVGEAQVTIRLLDPPLTEFFPDPGSSQFEAEMAPLAQQLQMEPDECIQRVRQMQESNPMLGLRGCRLSIVYPEITEMQTKAIVGAAIQARQEGIEVKPQILIPMVVTDHEVELILPNIVAAGGSVCAQDGNRYSLQSIEIAIGALIETPRACICADRIAAVKGVDFVFISSTDLTQLVFGVSREDAQNYMPLYLEKGLLSCDPFETIDESAVGAMIAMAVRRLRRGSPSIKIGACGWHCGDPKSVQLFASNEIDHVSCSPFRIPIAKVAAAQAQIEKSMMPVEEPFLERADLLSRIVKGQMKV